MSYLLVEQHHHGFVDDIQNPGRVNPDDQDENHQWSHHDDFPQVDFG